MVSLLPATMRRRKLQHTHWRMLIDCVVFRLVLITGRAITQARGQSRQEWVFRDRGMSQERQSYMRLEDRLTEDRLTRGVPVIRPTIVSKKSSSFCHMRLPATESATLFVRISDRNSRLQTSAMPRSLFQRENICLKTQESLKAKTIKQLLGAVAPLKARWTRR